MKIHTFAGALALLAAPPAIARQPPAPKPVQFARGTSATTINGGIRGDQSPSYSVSARAGQTMTVKLATSNASAYFNVTPRGADTAIFVGSIGGNQFSAKLPRTGDYIVMVYLMRSAARRNEAANYTLDIAVR